MLLQHVNVIIFQRNIYLKFAKIYYYFHIMI